MIDHHRSIRSYVLRGGRLTKLQQRALDGLSDRYLIPFAHEPVDLDSLFSNRPVVVEIGFGNGEATARIAEAYPDIGYLGIEVFPAGVGNLLHLIDTRGLYNVRIIRHDAVEALTCMIPEKSLHGVHLFFPDPWPKTRHHKRRIVQPDFVKLIASRLETEGYVYAVTDWEAYATWMLSVCTNEPELINDFTDFAPGQPWRPITRFEQKATDQGRTIRELMFRKRS